jgi:hypothetical protein
MWERTLFPAVAVACSPPIGPNRSGERTPFPHQLCRCLFSFTQSQIVVILSAARVGGFKVEVQHFRKRR